MPGNSHEGRQRAPRTWALWSCLVCSACGDAEPGGNVGGSGGGGPLPDVADMRDATGGGAGFDAADDTFGDEQRDDVAADTTPPRDTGVGDSDDGRPSGIDITGCVPERQTPRRLVSALYFMVDTTTSMDTVDMQQTMSRWNALVAGMSIFVDHPAHSDRLVGLDFFPERADDAGTALCLASDYVTPHVPIAMLGGSTSPHAMAIAAALAGRARGGNSPTGPALQGALQHARDWATSQPMPLPRVDVVLVTDGLPTGCSVGNTFPEVEAITRAAFFGTPSIRTHVLGLGQAPMELNAIAAAGGTNKAVYVTESNGAAVAAGLQTVRANSNTCEVAVEGVRDLHFVNFELRDADGGATLIFRVDSAFGCGTANGWYSNNAPQGTSAVLCPTSCAALDAGASVSALVGCRAIPPPP